MLDIHGFVATQRDKFFIVRGHQVWTSTGKHCLNGITSYKVIELCQQAGITCQQKDMSLFDGYGADEAFVTGTFGRLTPVISSMVVRLVPHVRPWQMTMSTDLRAP